MAGRSKTPQPQSADLTPERMRQGIKRLEAALQQVMAFDPDINSKDETSKADRLSAAIEAALTQTFGHGTIEFNRYNDAAQLQLAPELRVRGAAAQNAGSLRRCKNHSAEMLQEAIVFLRNELDLSSDEISTGSTMAAFPAKKPVGSNVVIGHGGSALWRELKDFLRDRLIYPVDEFNAVTVAGLPTVERLERMLNGARFAFLVMTARTNSRTER